MTTELVQPIAVYNQFREQLKELIAREQTVTFDYESEKGNKEARSYVANLRKSKTAVDEARKKEKESSLNYGRRVDSEAKEIISQIDSLIDKHAKVLEEIKQREENRVLTIRKRIENIEKAYLTKNPDGSNLSSSTITGLLGKVQGVAINDTFGEFQPQAQTAKDAAIFRLGELYNQAVVYEKEKKELEELRIKQAEQEKKDYEAKLVCEAEEKVRQENERKVQQEREDASRREQTLKFEAEKKERERAEHDRKVAESHEQALQFERDKAARLEREKIEAEQKAQKAKELAEASLADRLKKEKEEIEARERDKKHRTAKEDETIRSLLTVPALNNNANAAYEIVKAISLGKIKNVSINY